MLRLEGHVNGQPVSEDCASADTAMLIAASLLPTVDGSRLLFILGSLRTAALEGRAWGWSGLEFSLTMHRRQDGGD